MGRNLPLPHLLFTVSIALIFALGVLMVFGTSAAEVMDKGRSISTHSAFYRHLAYGMIGLVSGFIVWVIGAEAMLRLSPWAIALSLLLLALVVAPGVAQVHHGARRWLGIGSWGCQPSELAKISMPLFCLYGLGRSKRTWRESVQSGMAAVMTILLVLIEPDKGTAAILGMALVAVLIATQVPIKYWLFPILILVLIGGVAAWHSPYVIKRVQAYLDPESDLQGTGHQPYQARIAAGSGGVWGKGVGQSLQKLSYLPEAQNDYIAAIYAEEFGLVGSLGLIFLYLMMTASGFAIAHRAQTRDGMRLAAIFTFMIAIQAFLNLSVVTGLVPTTGLNLPFFSQGGTSLLTNICTAALILSIQPCRRPKLSSPPVEPVVI